MKTLTLTQPDDWHLHLRDEAYLHTTVPLAAAQFGRAIVMPNLKPPITKIADARNYHQCILSAIPATLNFQPLMTLYVTEDMSPAIVAEAKDSGFIYAFKLYPVGATTHSAHGVSDLTKVYPLFAAMEKQQMPLLVHAESVAETLDIFEREQHFLSTHLEKIIKLFPQLKIVVEHVSSEFGVNWVLQQSQHIAATITAHHLILTRNDVLVGGIKPHHYCLPIAKTERDRQALINAAISGNPKFFLGTDSAPHPKSQKESACGSAGIFTSHAAIELYAEVFEQANALDKLENFASVFGAEFYGLNPNQEKITLQKQAWEVPAVIPFGNDELVPFQAKKILNWKMQTS